MAAYVLSEVQILDAIAGKTYMALAERSIQLYGGRYLVRGQQPEAREGYWESGRRLVIVEFPSARRRAAWYDSSEYAEALQHRGTALTRRLLFVDGITDSATPWIGLDHAGPERREHTAP
jgi:uncharacterized protein (DUF1330 family)